MAWPTGCAFGIDVSKWQGEIDWERAYTRAKELSIGEPFAGIRVGSIEDATGRCYEDYQYRRNARLAPGYFKHVLLYWYGRPQWDGTEQAEYFDSLVSSEFGDVIEIGDDRHGEYCVYENFPDTKVRSVLDAEADGGRTPAQITYWINYLMGNYFDILYSRATWLNTYTTADLRVTTGWLARYPAIALPHPWLDAEALLKPRTFMDWSFWQFSADGNGRGAEFGVPATANKDIDLNWANGEMEPLPEVTPPGDDEMNEKLDAILDNQDMIVGKLNEIIARLDAQPAPAPDPEPNPQEWQAVVVGKDPRANAFFAKDLNAKGKPIMAIYPSDTSPVSERVQFAKGVTLLVAREATIADGGGEFYLVRGYVGKAGEPLYLRAIDLL